MYPGYLNLSKKELNSRAKKLFQLLEKCSLCPRKCEVNRLKGEQGFCQLDRFPKISAYHPHFGEEEVLVGRSGSGTIFFTSCNLGCVYCQNYEISQLRMGQRISFERLADCMIDLQNKGCHNINLVTPTPQVPQIVKALIVARQKGLKLPLVYNTNGYDSVETLKLLGGIVDIYMPDIKYSTDSIAKKYSLVPNYFMITQNALKEMHRQVGDLLIDHRGIAVKGLLVRHLVLPNNLAGSKKIFQFLVTEISTNTFVNIMDQYHPCYKAEKFSALSRNITPQEFSRTVRLAQKTGLKRILWKNKNLEEY